MNVFTLLKGKWCFINYKKEFPQTQGFSSWRPTFDRFWFGKIWQWGWRQYAIECDMRENWIEDMKNPSRLVDDET
jgi:hypothetical protein